MVSQCGDVIPVEGAGDAATSYGVPPSVLDSLGFVEPEGSEPEVIQGTFGYDHSRVIYRELEPGDVVIVEMRGNDWRHRTYCVLQIGEETASESGSYLKEVKAVIMEMGYCRRYSRYINWTSFAGYLGLYDNNGASYHFGQNGVVSMLAIYRRGPPSPE